MDDAVNFGGIGVVIGHEYTHGFDDQGAQVRRRGQPGQTGGRPTTARQFEERTGCIAEGVRRLRHREGRGERRRAPERPAHAGREHRRQRRPARLLHGAAEGPLGRRRAKPIDGFTPEQRFFLGFANVWCQNVTEAAARQLAQTDPHSRRRFRVIGSVSNMPEFQEAFGCKAGQPMVRENACRAW